MNVLVTGVCGFVGLSVASHLKESISGVRLIGLDNLIRKGSERNRSVADRLCETFLHADLRSSADLEQVGEVDWVIDCAALPSVLAGTHGYGSSRQLIDHNLIGTLNLLEFCRSRSAGLVLLSTSRVYSIKPLTDLPLVATDQRLDVDESQPLPAGVSRRGIDESFSTQPPVSLYGATKVASETMAMEYAAAFTFPLRINRCGVLAGAGQFGRADQGIFSYWIHSHAARKPLRYIGCGGTGHQVRDCTHPQDVAALIAKQIAAGDDRNKPIVCNVSAGLASSRSLCQLTRWCDRRFGAHRVASSDEVRPFDLPWIVLDETLAKQTWDWTPSRSTESILEEIAVFATEHPDWLEVSS